MHHDRFSFSSSAKMVSWAKIFAHSLIFFGVVATPVFGTDHFNLESGIPTTIEDIEPIERGAVELQGFGRYMRVRGGRNIGEAEPRLALGILDKTQVEIATPLLLGEGAANGNGDVRISILRKLQDDSQQEWWPVFALEADLTLPTGIERHGFKNRADAGFTGILKKEWGLHSFHLNAGFDWTDDRSQEENLRRSIWSVIVGHHTSLKEWAVLVSDLVWRQADDKDTRDIWLLESGVRAKITSKLIGAIGVGAGLNRGNDTPSCALTIGFQLGL